MKRVFLLAFLILITLTSCSTIDTTQSVKYPEKGDYALQIIEWCEENNAIWNKEMMNVITATNHLTGDVIRYTVTLYTVCTSNQRKIFVVYHGKITNII